MSTANPPPPDIGDLRGLAHNLRQLFEIAATTLADDAGPSELAQRVTGHLGCELTAIVPVTERFPKWEHVNVQRGVDAYLAARQGEMAQDEPEWFGAPGAGVHPHENLLSLLSTPARAGGIRIAGPRGIRVAGAGTGGTGAASYGTAAIGPEENTEVVTFGLVATPPRACPRGPGSATRPAAGAGTGSRSVPAPARAPALTGTRRPARRAVPVPGLSDARARWAARYGSP